MQPSAADRMTSWSSCSRREPFAASAAGCARSSARGLVEQGAHKVIVGTAAFHGSGVNTELLAELASAIGRDRLIIAVDSKGGRIVVKGWREATELTAEQALQSLEPYCSGFLCTY